MKIFYTTLLLCLLSAKTIEAQTSGNGFSYSENEYSVYATAGAANFQHSLAKGGETKGSVGFGAGLAYICNVSSTFGISLGLELSSFRGETSYKSLQETYEAIDDQEDLMEYSYSIDNYREKQNMMLLSLPLMARYNIPVGNTGVYFAGGLKFGFPVRSKVKISAENVISTGYYDRENITYDDPNHGFFSGQNISNKQGTIKGLSMMTILSVEAGMRFDLEGKALCAGVYFDYCPNSPNLSKNRHPLNYNRDISYESVLNSSLSSKLNLMSIGLKVQFSLF
ncbi:MAG: PorT family protein [Prevotellaceae bacterium]|jgi:hypothetical protein|nr:PorT family protein [Prevotellaceae bacterium]